MGNGEVAGGGRERGWCVVAMETLSPSLIIIWGKMARGLLPRVTPPFPPFAPSLSLSIFLSRLRFLSLLPFPSRWQLRFFFGFFLLAFFHVLLLASSSTAFLSSSPPTASSIPSTSHPASPRRLIAPRHLLCPPREYYACTLPGRLCNHP